MSDKTHKTHPTGHRLAGTAAATVAAPLVYQNPEPDLLGSYDGDEAEGEIAFTMQRPTKVDRLWVICDDGVGWTVRSLLVGVSEQMVESAPLTAIADQPLMVPALMPGQQLVVKVTRGVGARKRLRLMLAARRT